MGLLSKLKSLLGADDDDGSRGSGVDVTVEREPSAESERAVKESTAGDEDADDVETMDDDAADGDEVDDPVAAESEAAASTESLVDEEHADDPTRAAEPAEAAATGDEDDAEPEPEPESAPAAGSDEPVSSVKGIGPAYAERLADAGVDTVAELAVADPEDLADETGLSAKRVGRWVESAQDWD